MKRIKQLGERTVEAELENWTDPVKLPAVLVTGLVLGTVIFLHDPKGAPTCKIPSSLSDKAP